jgi:hypothetical protein
MSGVALNWIITKGAIPIPGASSVEQVHTLYLLFFCYIFLIVPGEGISMPGHQALSRCTSVHSILLLRIYIYIYVYILYILLYFFLLYFSSGTGRGHFNAGASLPRQASNSNMP